MNEQLEVAPDGSTVRPLMRSDRASAAEFRLCAGGISHAVRHRQVEEIWHVIAGSGALWRQREGFDEVVALEVGSTVVVEAGMTFQFRASSELRVFAVTIPPWPKMDREADLVPGRWVANVG